MELHAPIITPTCQEQYKIISFSIIKEAFLFFFFIFCCSGFKQIDERPQGQAIRGVFEDSHVLELLGS
ncbi:hypothetical protein CUMW_289650 [Citrus unshiu]|uniref:Uncharacterized protein n=1 Tax=Citrus unshiu TaxID=55188 RepID=A0A2H5QY14_CITUN|nr:hypothetical protein CUMW_289650 [Citrus unshiu]